MKRWIVNRVLDRFARQWNYDVSYMRAMFETSPAAFRKFGAVAALSDHREVVPVEASFAARIVGVMAEDCGPCTQLAADMARAAGMNEDQIVAVLSGDAAAMNTDVALAVAFSDALVRRNADLDTKRQTVRARWGEGGIIDLTFAAQMARIYPLVKAGMGYDETCQTIRVGATSVVPGLKIAA